MWCCLRTYRLFGLAQAEKTKQEARSKDESVRRMEEKLQAAEAKLKAKEQMCQALSDKVGVCCFCRSISPAESVVDSKLPE